jgi:uncharacterized protein (TIGR03083 family)
VADYDVTERSTSVLYRSAVADAIALFRSLDTDDWATPVPCTPAWTIRDVLSHVSGVADDITNGRVEGAASDPWTAAQVERYRHDDPADLLTRWNQQAPTVADLIEAIGEQRPVFDCCTHEHDVRHAIGRPGNRTSAVLDFAAGQLIGTAAEAGILVALTDPVDPSDLRPSTPLDHPVDPTPQERPEPVTVSGLSRFELFRSRIGRRSRNQVAAYAWSGPDEAVEAAIDAWFVFGPSPTDIDEGLAR